MGISRWINLLCGAALVFAALAFLIFVPGNISDYAREPEDVWLGLLWVCLLSSLAALCFTNARDARYGWRKLANFVAVILLAGLLAIGSNDPAVLPLIALCAFGPLTALVSEWRHSRVSRN